MKNGKDDHIFKVGDEVIFTDCKGKDWPSDMRYPDGEPLYWARTFLNIGNIHIVKEISEYNIYTILLDNDYFWVNAHQFKLYKPIETDQYEEWD